MSKEQLLFERQELYARINSLEIYKLNVTNEVELKHIAYQLVSMKDYLNGLNARIQMK